MVRRALVCCCFFACGTQAPAASVTANVAAPPEVEETPWQTDLPPLEHGAEIERSGDIERRAASAGYTLGDDGLVHGSKLVLRNAHDIGWFGRSSTGEIALVVGMRIDDAHPNLQDVLVRGDRATPIRCDNGIASAGGPCAPLWIGASLVRAEITIDPRATAEHVVVRRDERRVFETHAQILWRLT